MEKVRCCGAIIIKDGKVLLVHQNNDVWGFPKGHMEEGETEVETAIREVKEETNLDIELDENKKYELSYTTDCGKYKTVVLFIAKPISNDIVKQDNEIEEVRYVDFNEAFNIINYDNLKDMWKKVIKENNLC